MVLGRVPTASESLRAMAKDVPEHAGLLEQAAQDIDNGCGERRQLVGVIASLLMHAKVSETEDDPLDRLQAALAAVGVGPALYLMASRFIGWHGLFNELVALREKYAPDYKHPKPGPKAVSGKCSQCGATREACGTFKADPTIALPCCHRCDHADIEQRAKEQAAMIAARGVINAGVLAEVLVSFAKAELEDVTERVRELRDAVQAKRERDATQAKDNFHAGRSCAETEMLHSLARDFPELGP